MTGADSSYHQKGNSWRPPNSRLPQPQLIQTDSARYLLILGIHFYYMPILIGNPVSAIYAFTICYPTNKPLCCTKGGLALPSPPSLLFCFWQPLDSQPMLEAAIHGFLYINIYLLGLPFLFILFPACRFSTESNTFCVSFSALQRETSPHLLSSEKKNPFQCTTSIAKLKTYLPLLNQSQHSL